MSGGQIFRNVLNTAKEIVQNRGMFLFVLAYFFYVDGVGTVISISTAYGTALGLGAVGMILALLVTQIVAMPSSILFGRMAQKISTRRAIMIAIVVYMVICCVGFIMGFTLEPHQDAFDAGYISATDALTEEVVTAHNLDKEAVTPALDAYYDEARAALLAQDAYSADPLLKVELDGVDAATADAVNTRLAAGIDTFAQENNDIRANYRAAISRSSIMFWAMALLVGTVQGGIQAVSRSYFGKLVPKNRSNEFFGFFDIFGKFATVVGPLLYAVIGSMTGRSSYGTLALLTLFLMGFLILWRAKKPLQELEQRQAALEA